MKTSRMCNALDGASLLKLVCAHPARRLHVAFSAPPEDISQWSRGAIIAGGVEWGCLTPGNHVPEAFVRRVLKVLWQSTTSAVALTESARFGDAFQKVDVRLGASALQSDPSDVIHPSAPLVSSRTNYKSAPDDHERHARQSCTSPSWSSDLTWMEPYAGALALYPGFIRYAFTTTGIVQGDCIELSIWQDLSGQFGAFLISSLR